MRYQVTEPLAKGGKVRRFRDLDALRRFAVKEQVDWHRRCIRSGMKNGFVEYTLEEIGLELQDVAREWSAILRTFEELKGWLEFETGLVVEDLTERGD